MTFYMSLFKIASLSLFAIMLTNKSVDQFSDLNNPKPEGGESLTLLFIGDVMQHIEQINSARDAKTGQYVYDSCFNRISGLISSADLSIANFEVTLGGKPYSGYPQFCAPDSLVPALQRAGIDVLVTANNHSCDRGLKGIRRTIRVLDSLQIVHTGTFSGTMDRDTLYPLILEKNGIILGLLNYTYGTNGIPVPSPAIVNLIDTLQIRKDYDKARKKGVDEVIAFFHWGKEYMRESDTNQRKLAEFCHKLGIRIVIGSHPHVIQPMEAFSDSLGNIRDVTVYSLGNFISNQRDRYKCGGALFRITLTRDMDGIRIADPGYILAWVHAPFRYGKVWYQVLPVMEYEGNKGCLSKPDSVKMAVFTVDSRQLLNSKNLNVSEFMYQQNLSDPAEN
jgi:poly-gamma-glutamate capsule biosynthesis protein CapA/YwtB (metallophosphatase superfamily)